MIIYNLAVSYHCLCIEITKKCCLSLFIKRKFNIFLTEIVLFVSSEYDWY